MKLIKPLIESHATITNQREESKETNSYRKEHKESNLEEQNFEENVNF